MAQTTARDFITHVAIGALATFFVSWLDIRPMGVLCIAGLLTWIYSLFCPCRFTLENVKPIKDKLRGNVETFAKLRREKPAIFCLIVSVALFLLMIMGHILSGTWLVIGGLSVVGFIASKHSIRIVRAPNVNPTPNDSSAPPPTSSGPTTSVWSTTIAAAPLLCSTPGATNSETDDEFLPEANESAIHVLNLAGDDAILLSAKTPGGDGDDEDEDSVPLEMLLPDDTVPDVERDNLTDDNLSDDEFRLRGEETRSRAKVQSKNAAALLDLNTSDEEEDSLSRGLNYDEYNVVDHASQPLVASYHSHKGTSRPKEEHRGLTDFVANIIPWNKVGTLVADQMTRSEPSSTTHQQTKKRRGGRTEKGHEEPLLDTSSDDSEFEILNPDELQNYGT